MMTSSSAGATRWDETYAATTSAVSFRSLASVQGLAHCIFQSNEFDGATIVSSMHDSDTIVFSIGAALLSDSKLLGQIVRPAHMPQAPPELPTYCESRRHAGRQRNHPEHQALGSGRAPHSGNPVTRWMAANVAVAQDPAGNLKPAKDKCTERIDGIVAAIMAIGRALELLSVLRTKDNRS